MKVFTFSWFDVFDEPHIYIHICLHISHIYIHNTRVYMIQYTVLVATPPRPPQGRGGGWGDWKSQLFLRNLSFWTAPEVLLLHGVQRCPQSDSKANLVRIVCKESQKNVLLGIHADPGMEMMPECNGCMCHNSCKNNLFWVIPLFYSLSNFGLTSFSFSLKVDGLPWKHASKPTQSHLSFILQVMDL